MAKGRLVSPNDLYEAAKAAYLNGADPTTDEEWQQCVNFWAHNIDPALSKSACKLMALIFSCPLAPEVVDEIVDFQLNQHKAG